MKIIVHGPKNADAEEELKRRVASLHAESVIAYIRKMPISTEEKVALLRSVCIKQKDSEV